MELFTLDNVVTGVCVVAAILAFYGLGEYTNAGAAIRYGVLLLVGVVLPMVVTNYVAAE